MNISFLKLALGLRRAREACNTSQHGELIGLGIVAFTLNAMRTLPFDRLTAGPQAIAAGSPVHRIPVGRLARPMRP